MQVCLCQMADRKDDDFVSSYFENSAMSWFRADSKVEFANGKLESVVLSSDWTSIRIFTQGGERILKRVEPAMRLFGRTVFRPPKSLIKQLLFCARQNDNAEGHGF